jgi:ribonuclease BN (tRNA processing enzyme)
MKLTFIGTGSAFTMTNFQSNMLLEDSGKRLLIDCGGDARHALAKAGLTANDVDALYVSHLHADHIGGIEWLGFSRYFAKGPKPDLYVNERLSHALWDHSLRGGMASHQGVVLTLDHFFSAVHRIPQNGSFRWGHTDCQLVQTVHYMDGYEIVPSYGLLMRVDTNPSAGEIFLTTDTQFAPNQIMDFYRRSSVIFQDCETSAYKSGVHAHDTELVTLPADVRAKMWLYHYQDGPLPDARKDGFAGFIERGQSFEF